MIVELQRNIGNDQEMAQTLLRGRSSKKNNEENKNVDSSDENKQGRNSKTNEGEKDDKDNEGLHSSDSEKETTHIGNNQEMARTVK